jgi:hypothetical protein
MWDCGAPSLKTSPAKTSPIANGETGFFREKMLAIFH